MATSDSPSTPQDRQMSMRRLVITTVLAAAPALAFIAYFLVDDVTSGRVTDTGKVVVMVTFAVVVLGGYFGNMSGMNQRIVAAIIKRRAERRKAE